MLMNRSRAQRLMAEQGLDALFLRNALNVTYASDFHNAGASLASRPFAAVAFRDAALEPFLVVPSVDFRLAKHMSWIQDVRAYIRAEKASDRDREFYPDFFAAVRAGFQDRKAAGLRLCLIGRIRAVKTPEEIANLKRAAEITVKAHDSFRQAIAVGATERDLALAAQFTMLREGAEKVGFIYVGSNATRGFAHHPFPTDVPLKRGDFVKVDMGCVYRGYESDFVRSYILGRATDRQQEVYRALDEGSLAIGMYLKPGRSCIDVYNWGFTFMNERLPGYAREFLGHGIGLGPHEEPRLHEGNPMVLEPGMVICIEHSFYLDGARYHFEDTFVIEESGPVCWTAALGRSLEVAV
ncbi:MAG: aminopeptidase P family protein [candidate division NC10 bacterium]|nr:aminopeptidase P family protein [candidate division NC10 bacterium]